jgi:hypothetical protein
MEDRLLFSGIGECSFGIATIGIHKYGVFNEENPSLCLIYGDTGTHWIGRWVSSYCNFFDILFSKGTVKELTDADEQKYYSIMNGELAKSLIAKHQDDAQRNLLKPSLSENR